MKYYIRNGKILNGWKYAAARFFDEVFIYYSLSGYCSYSETSIYIPKFLLTPNASSQWSLGVRNSLYGKLIIIEMNIDGFWVQFSIMIDHITDFSNIVNRNKDIDFYEITGNRSFYRVENLYLALSQAHKFIHGILLYLNSRSLNVITVSSKFTESLIQGFGSGLDPRGSFTRHLLSSF